MISKEKAYKLVEKQLRKLEFNDVYLIDEHNSQEYEDRWVIAYNAKTYLETKDDAFALLGNAPFVVMKATGKVVATMSSDAEYAEGWISGKD
ncbi:MAG: hypothetical protein HOM11_12190 [Methylococcales bacterium]|jgi:hypothetical protein|nr:hypothetical protein [Methylococcales bacterium]MBT7443477.1 hypothetical protein [Methylococcales bacterium]